MSMLMRKNDLGLLYGESPFQELLHSMFLDFPEQSWKKWMPESRMRLKVADDLVKVTFPCPGCSRTDFTIETSGGFLTVKVAKRVPAHLEGAEKHITCHERSFEEFEESVKLPVEVESSGAKAKYTDGVLEITLPRLLEKKPASRVIDVQ